MRLPLVLAALILLAELVGAVVFATQESWLVCAGLVLLAAAEVLIAWRLIVAVTKPTPTGYVEREQQFY